MSDVGNADPTNLDDEPVTPAPGGNSEEPPTDDPVATVPPRGGDNWHLGLDPDA